MLKSNVFRTFLAPFVALAVLATIAITGTASPSVAQAADPFVETFEFSGAIQSWTAPANVFEVQVELWAGAGGGRTGGLGGYVQTRLAVVPGQTYEIRVGGEGANTVAGWNGGGTAPTGSFGGGGASDVRAAPYGLTERRVVAGGGGGGANPNLMHVGAGGAGGGLVGGDGQEGLHYLVTPVSGGTQTTGRSNGVGGKAFCNNACSGAGGGGWFGGEDGDHYAGSGVQGGGGGGSGHAAPGYTAETEMLDGVRKGAGSAIITFPVPDNAPVDPPAPDSLTFEHTGIPEYWTVPEGLTEIEVIAWGGQGGGAWGGAGGRTTAVIAVVPGETLQLNVGGAGGMEVGGFNGGGYVRNGDGSDQTGGGGGATDIRAGGISAHERIVVAGGGGGAAQNAGPLFGSGGSGGGWVGGDGGVGRHWILERNAGGTQTSGAFFGRGGEGFCNDACSGGGGGGWWGGFEGDDYFWSHPQSGGAGGSGHVAGSRGQATEMLNQVQLGHGRLTISWPPETPTPPPSSTGSESFSFTGGPQYWTVPEGVNGISVIVSGAAGGGLAGGEGGTSTAIVPVVAGQQVTVVVGGAGDEDTAGYNGGGWGPTPAYGGGGGSDVRLGGPRLFDRLVVGGGGGGESGAGPNGSSGGGAGGGWEGVPGEVGPHWILQEHPGGGQESGYEFAEGEDGFCNSACSGAGGGGWIGGFAGDDYFWADPQSGGSGGSGWVSDYAVGGSLQTGGNPGDGSVTISWPAPVPVEETLGENEYGEVVLGVQVGSGNAVEQARDFALTTAGPELYLDRTFNSMDERVGLFGKGWSSTFEMAAAATTEGVTITWPDGRREKHSLLPDGSYKGPSTYTNKLSTRVGGGWDLTTREDTVYAFDASGRLDSITDDYGRALNLNYTGAQLTSVVDATSGRSLTFTYSGDRVIRAETNAVTGSGYAGPLAWNYGYDATNTYLEQACDPRYALGTRCSKYERDASDRLEVVRSPRGSITRTLTYDGSNRVATVASMEGTWTFTYATGFTQVLNPRGFKWTYWSDAGLRTTRITDPLNHSILYGYDDKGFRDAVTDANGARVEMTYEDGNLVSSKNAMSQTTWFEFDAENHLVATRDPRSSGAADNTYATLYTVNAQGDVLTETSPATDEYPSGVTTSYTYTTGGEDHGFGSVPAGLTRTAFDGLGTTTLGYDSEGDLRRIEEPTGLVTTFDHDELGRETSAVETWADGSATTTTTYDQVGNVLTETAPPATDIVGDGVRQQRSQYTYDANSNPIAVRLRDAGVAPGKTPLRVIKFRYDTLDRLWRSEDPLGGVTIKDFDDNGNVIRVTDPLGRVIETEYDELDRPERVVLKDFVDDPIAGSTPRDAVLKEYIYDAAGRLLVERDPQPGTGGVAGQLDPVATPMRETFYGYDAADRQVSVVQQAFDDLGGAVRPVEVVDYTLDAAGNITEERYGDGKQAVQHVYDQAGMRQQSTLVLAAGNRVSHYDYDAGGNIVSVGMNPTGDPVEWFQQTRYSYNDAGFLLSTEVENGVSDLLTTYVVDQRGLTTSVTSPRGNVPGTDPANFTTDYLYDSVGQIVRQTMAPVQRDTGTAATTVRPTREYAWDAVGNLVTMVDERAKTTSYSYDKLDRLLVITHPRYTPRKSAAIEPTEHYDYDAVGNLITWTDRRGEVTDYTFDQRNRVVRQQDPLVTGEAARGELFFGYDDAGNLTRTVDQSGAETTRTYDDFGRVRTQSLIERTTAATLTSTFNYDDLGNMTSSLDPSGVVVSMMYNEASELVSAVDALGKATTYGYDPAGRTVSVTDPLGRTTETVFDTAGRPVGQQRLDSVGGTVLAEAHRTFDPDGNVVEVRDSRSVDAIDNTFLTSFERDALGRLASVTEPGTASPITTSYGYDEAGNLLRLIDGRGKQTTYLYNEWNQLERIRFPTVNNLELPPGVLKGPARLFYYTYDAAGAPLTEEQPGPTIITNTYDELGRRLQTAAAGEAPAATSSFGYDLVGRRTEVSHPDGPIAVSYDDRGLIVSTSEPGLATVQSSYTYDAAGRMQGRSDGAGLTTFTYDARGLLETVSDGLTADSVTFGHNDAGQRTTTNYGSSGATRDYTYDSFGWLETDTLTEGGGGAYSVTYGYDTGGRITSQDIVDPDNPAAGAHSYDYDESGRLMSWTDSASAVTEYAYDDAGNRVSAGGTNYSYDNRNQLRSGGGIVRTWTPRGTLASFVEGGVTTDVEFDGLGRQIEYGAETYSYDGLDRIATADAEAFTYAGFAIDPTTVGAELFARDPQGSLMARSSGSDAAWVGSNLHGDTTWLLDSAAGDVTASAVYDPFGEVAGASGNVGSLGFQGDYTSDSGLVWMGARWYNPSVGSFTSRDTVLGNTMRAVSLNQYTYAWNDPVSMFDPDGHLPGFIQGAIDVGRKVGGGIGSGLSKIGRAIESRIAPYRSKGRSALSRLANRVGNSGFARKAASVANRARSQFTASARAATARVQTAIRKFSASCGSTCRRVVIGAAVIGIAVFVPATAPSILYGAAIGTGVGVHRCGGDAGCVLDSALAGAAGGAVTPGGTGTFGKAVLQGVAGGAVDNAASQFLEGGDFSFTEIAYSGAMGGAFSGGFYAVGKAIGPAFAPLTRRASSYGDNLGSRVSNASDSLGSRSRGAGAADNFANRARATRSQMRANPERGAMRLGGAADNVGGNSATAAASRPSDLPRFVVDSSGAATDLDSLFSRAGFRNGAVDDMWTSASPGSAAGLRQCPTCLNEVPRRNARGHRPWDGDHQPTWGSRTVDWYNDWSAGRAGLPSRPEILDSYNEGLRLQCPTCNRSNRFNTN